MADKKQTVRTRMAPSPTGEYHIGHIRTLLYNWAFARQQKGKFIIRIEDTDRERYIKGAVDRILSVVSDYGFDWDEGPKVGGKHGPYVQSERLKIYNKYAQELIDKAAAYYCFCTPERLDKMRAEQKRAGVASTKYDRHCLKLSAGEVDEKLNNKVPYVIRLRVPDNKNVEFKDKVFGKVVVNSNELDDQILIKSDGFPTYHMAVVVDDHLMKITHVMRGNDWIPSTPKHVLLYEAFAWDTPEFIHLPNLKELGATKKLSKRFGPVSAREFLAEGYLPEAIANFLMLLGWNPGTDKEFYSLEEFIRDFSLEKIHKTDLVAFDRSKLLWMNGHYIQKLANSNLKTRIYEFYDKKYPEDKIERTIPLVKTRIKTLKEFEELAGFFFERPEVDEKLLGENWREHVRAALNTLDEIIEWNLENINKNLMETVTSNNFHTGKFFMDLRIAVTGNKQTPPINESIELLGKEEILNRLDKVLGG
jgi:glutamyl-tRNA synthetase